MNSNQRGAIRADVLRVMRRGEQRWWTPTQLSRAIADLPMEGGAGQRLQPRATAVSEVLLGLLSEGLIVKDQRSEPLSPTRYAMPWVAQEEARERQSGRRPEATEEEQRNAARAERVRGYVLKALSEADVEWRTADSIAALAGGSLSWTEAPSLAETRDALRLLVGTGNGVIRRSPGVSRDFEYRYIGVGETAEKVEDAREQVIRALAESTATPTLPVPAPERPEPIRASFVLGQNPDGTWYAQADGLTSVEARTLAGSFGNQMARRGGL